MAKLPEKVNTKSPGNILYTRVEALKCVQVWKIGNFSQCGKKVGEKIVSPRFLSGSNNELQWNLVMFPHGKTEDVKEYISLFLTLMPSCKIKTQIDLQFSLLNVRMEKFGKTCGVSSFSKDEEVTNWKMAFCGWESFIKRDLVFMKKDELLPQDVLTVYCEANVKCEQLDLSNLQEPISVKVPEFSLGESMAIYFYNKKFSDVVIRCGKYEFKAHRAILAANSPTFDAMFNADTKENGRSIVEIEDLGSDVFSELLYFLYTGKVRAVDREVAVSLLGASEKFMLPRLKAICEERLAAGLRVNTICETLVLADTHSATQLKKQCLEFIRRYAAEIVRSEAWKTMATKQPHLVLDAFNALALDTKKQNMPEGQTITVKE